MDHAVRGGRAWCGMFPWPSSWCGVSIKERVALLGLLFKIDMIETTFLRHTMPIAANRFTFCSSQIWFRLSVPCAVSAVNSTGLGCFGKASRPAGGGLEIKRVWTRNERLIIVILGMCRRFEV